MALFLWDVWRAGGRKLACNLYCNEDNYRSIYPATKRLHAMLSEHFMRVNPNSFALKPKKKEG